MRRVVVTLRSRDPGGPLGHDVVSCRAIAERLASAMHAEYAGEFDPDASYPGRRYFVPDDALDAPRAKELGIVTPGDLYGGVVPHAFVATKAITHPLVRWDARAPGGWNPAFAVQIAGAALRGYTAFTPDDVREAVRALLPFGRVRLKAATGIGGGGQTVVDGAAGAEDALLEHDPSELAHFGMVVEEDLEGVTTYSVGQVGACGLTLSYCGTQRTVRNGQGDEIYGGSTLECARGGFDALLAVDLADAERRAVELARRYDEAALGAFPGFFASRRNYDVARGVDAAGHVRTGVLEQSWRIGGASGAELMAIEAMIADPAIPRVRAATVESYQRDPAIPADAFVYFRGSDKHGDPLVKYATLATDVDAR